MNKTRILIVQDEVVTARDLSDRLTELGYEPVAQTTTGEQALVLAEQLRPDMALMDVPLAGDLDGIATAQILLDRFSMPVVFLTARLEDSILDRAKAAQPYGYLLRPYQLIELRMAIDLALTKHQAETRMRRNQEDLATILRTAMDGFAIVDMQTRILEVNDTYCRMSGYTREELLRMSISDLAVDMSADEIDRLIDQHKHAGYAHSEYRHRHKDGRILDFELSLNYQPASGGRFFGFVRDITKRKRAEEALRESEAKYRAIFENEPECVKLLDREGRLLEMNPAGLAMLQATSDQVRGKQAVGLVADEDQAAFNDMVKAVFRGEIRHLVFDMIGLEGRRLTLETTSVPLNDTGPTGGVKALLGVTRDITEGKRAEEALRESEKRFKLSMEATSDGLWDWNIKTDKGYFSPSYYRMLGYEVGAFPEEGSAWNRLIHPDDREQALLANMDCIEGRREYFEVEYRMKAKSGEWRWILGRGKCVERDAQGRALRLVGTHVDITGRKRAEAEKAELEAQNRQLKKSESLGRMAGAIAHHFNNKLAAVMVNLDLARDTLPREADAVTNLDEAMQAARQAAEVSGMMLTYLGYTPGKRMPLDLSATCQRSLSLLQAAVPKNVVLETDLPSPGPTVSADANQLHQVLTNLLTNAWEAVGEARGTIRLTVKTVAATEIPSVSRFPVDWRPHDRIYACLEVTDTGHGIAAQDMERLFEPFFSHKFVGRGLGLPVVLGIARAHDGVVTVASEPGRESVFRVFFPLSPDAVPQPPDRAAPAPGFTGDGTMLLVEDEDVLRKVTTKRLTRSGFKVLVARDGAEAVELFRQHQDEIRFVLCDLIMPRMNGWETLAALRQLAPGIPVILSSGYHEDQAQSMIGDHHEQPQAFLSKPYTSEELINAINQALARQRGKDGCLDG